MSHTAEGPSSAEGKAERQQESPGNEKTKQQKQKQTTSGNLVSSQRKTLEWESKCGVIHLRMVSEATKVGQVSWEEE